MSNNMKSLLRLSIHIIYKDYYNKRLERYLLFSEYRISNNLSYVLCVISPPRIKYTFRINNLAIEIANHRIFTKVTL